MIGFETKKELVDLLIWAYIEGWNNASKLITQAKPNEDEMRKMVNSILELQGTYK